jgi:hypothetical protein
MDILRFRFGDVKSIYDLAKEIARLEWIAAGSPPAQKAEYEARIQRYKEYPRDVLEEEHKRLLAIYEQEDNLFINPQEQEAFKREQEQLRVQRKEWLRRHYEWERELMLAYREGRRPRRRSPADISTDTAPHIGTKDVPAGSENYISRDDIEDGDEMVELHGNPAHIYKKSSLNQWISTRKKQFPHNPIKNPITAENINQENIKRYTAKIKKIGGITTHAAPHIGTRNIPEGSEDYITNETIEEGDEMVELHGHADHIYKKSSINQWISKRKEQFPRNPIKNPYTGEYINQENIKRYTAKLKTKPKNKDKNKNNAPKSGGSKKRKSLRVRHRSRKSQ